MISEKMIPLMKNNSAIRMMFEEGNKLAAKYGRENVFDFSLGNPSVPAPAEVNQAIQDIVKEEDSLFVHGYMSNAGYEDVRETIAQSLNRRFGTSFHAGNILMTVGLFGVLMITALVFSLIFSSNSTRFGWKSTVFGDTTTSSPS